MHRLINIGFRGKVRRDVRSFMRLLCAMEIGMNLGNSFLKIGSLNTYKYGYPGQLMPALIAANCDVLCLQEVPQDALGILEYALDASAYYVPMLEYTDRQLGTKRISGLAMMVKRCALNAYDYFTYHHATEHDTPFPADRVLQHMKIEKDGVPYNIANTHLTWTPDGKPSSEQLRDIDELFEILSDEVDEEIILCGDFNAPRIALDGTRGPVWAMFAERFRDNIPSSVITTLDSELHRVSDLCYVVDGCFTSPEYEVSDMEFKSGVSDHVFFFGKVARRNVA